MRTCWTACRDGTVWSRDVPHPMSHKFQTQPAPSLISNSDQPRATADVPEETGFATKIEPAPHRVGRHLAVQQLALGQKARGDASVRTERAQHAVLLGLERPLPRIDVLRHGLLLPLNDGPAARCRRSVVAGPAAPATCVGVAPSAGRSPGGPARRAAPPPASCS